MKKLLLICLLAGCSHCFAQNVGLKELLRVMETSSVDWVNRYLAPLGYIAGEKEVIVAGIDKASAHTWGFRSDKNPDAPTMAGIYKIIDTAGTKLVYETSNSFFYTNILNQLPLNNFLFRQASSLDNQVTLLFSNGVYWLSLETDQDIRSDKSYTITLRPVNNSQKTSVNQPNDKQPKIRLQYDHNNTY